MKSSSRLLMPSKTAASISPCFVIATSNLSRVAVGAWYGRNVNSATPETFACRLPARQDVEQ
jgi:hypothetical protein